MSAPSAAGFEAPQSTCALPSGLALRPKPPYNVTQLEPVIDLNKLAQALSRGRVGALSRLIDHAATSPYHNFVVWGWEGPKPECAASSPPWDYLQGAAVIATLQAGPPSP